MNHSAIHGNSLAKYFIDQTWSIRTLECCDTTLRYSQINRLGEIERHSGWVTKIYILNIIIGIVPAEIDTQA